MPTSSRHHARELALQALYASQMGNVPPDAEFSNVISDEETVPPGVLQYARGLYDLVSLHGEWADGHIRTLADNWVLERIAAVDRTILRMAMVELKFLPDVPVKVVLNEAIELAKTFSTPESPAFVNGILDSFLKALEASQP